MANAHPHAFPDSQRPTQAAARVTRRRMLGASLGAGHGLAAATSIRSLLAVDTAYAAAGLASPPTHEGSLTMEMHGTQASIRTSADRLSSASMQSVSDIRMVSPALERYMQGTLFGGLWTRPDLSVRDRSIVTLAALITRNQTIEMPSYVNLALDNGVTPGEISEIITHLAFYSGWANATSAIAVVKEIFSQRGIGADQLPPASPQLLPLDQAAEEARATRVQQDVGPVSPGLVQYTGELLFRDLWLRPTLAPRDRSLVTVSALIASGQVAQMPFQLNRAMDNGLTKAQASEVLAHLAFYAGWPNVFSAVPVAKSVFDGRPS
jgi:4-carboxymuconolactone decarboxylase